MKIKILNHQCLEYNKRMLKKGKKGKKFIDVC